MSLYAPLLNPNPNRIPNGGMVVGVHDFGRELSASLVLRMLRNIFGRRNISVVPLTRAEYERVHASLYYLSHYFFFKNKTIYL